MAEDGAVRASTTTLRVTDTRKFRLKENFKKRFQNQNIKSPELPNRKEVAQGDRESRGRVEGRVPSSVYVRVQAVLIEYKGGEATVS